MFINKIITVVLGAILWILATYTLGVEQIGELTIFIAGSLLVGNIAVFGINTTIIRYFPELKSLKQQNQFLFLSFLIPIALSFIFSPFFWFITGYNIIFKFYHLFLFLSFSVIHSVSVIYDSLNIAQRTVKLILFRNLLISLFKVFSLVSISFVTEITIDTFLLISLIPQVSFFALFVVYDFFHNVKTRYELINKAIPSVNLTFSRALRFSIYSYISSILINSPIDFLPILAGRMLGSSYSAYINFGWIIGGMFIFLVSYSMSILLARKEYHENIIFHLKLMIGLFLLLTIGLLFYELVANSVINIFLGVSYLPVAGVGLFFALSSFPAIIFFYGITRLRLDNIEEYTLIPAIFVFFINLIIPLLINPRSAKGYSLIFFYSYIVAGGIVVLIYYLKQSNT